MIFQISQIYGHVRKFDFWVFTNLGYNHKNLNSNTAYMAYKMVIRVPFAGGKKKNYGVVHV